MTNTATATGPIPFPVYAPTCDLAQLTAKVVRSGHRLVHIPKRHPKEQIP